MQYRESGLLHRCVGGRGGGSEPDRRPHCCVSTGLGKLLPLPVHLKERLSHGPKTKNMPSR